MKKHPPVLPEKPGVYLFKNDQGDILYIGKAKSLKKRVASYFNKQHQDWKIGLLFKDFATIAHIETATEAEASVLEAQLIQHYQPSYNTLLKEGNPFLYIVFSNDTTPIMSLTRIKKGSGTFFGPFLHKRQARSIFQYLLRTFRLRVCNRDIQQGCLDYHLGICAGMCVSSTAIDEYKSRIQLAQKALTGDLKEFLATIHQQMAQYGKLHLFEKARNLLLYLEQAEHIFTYLKAQSPQHYAPDVAAATIPMTTPMTSDQKNAGHVQLQKLLQLSGVPETIDCFDVSHLQGKYIVGSCIRFQRGEPLKHKFRKFMIQSLQNQNDYAALQEIVKRRYKSGDFPDLILIDGGKGQLSAVQQIITNVPIVSLAKREERLFSNLFPEGTLLDYETPEGRLLIFMRDYAHHFAIKYHIWLRRKGSSYARTAHARN